MKEYSGPFSQLFSCNIHFTRLLAEIFPEMDVLCTIIEENREQWKEIEATGKYRKFEVPATYSAPLSPLPELEKCKIERKLNALQLNTWPDYESETSTYSNSSWLRTNGEDKAETNT